MARQETLLRAREGKGKIMNKKIQIKIQHFDKRKDERINVHSKVVPLVEGLPNVKLLTGTTLTPQRKNEKKA